MQGYPASFLICFHRLSLLQLRRSLIILLLLLSLAQTGEAAGTPQPLQIAITPCTDILKTFKEYQPLATYLERELHTPIKLVIPKDFPEFERLVTNRGVEFTFQAPHTYVRLAHLYNRALLLKALTPEGESKHRGVIIVRKDSPLQRIQDLKGKYVIFGAENDMAKNLSAKRLLAAKGLNPDKDLRGYKHDGSCESIALNVFLKTADAGAICDYSFKNINESKEISESEIPPHQLRILDQTEEIPTWVFAARAGVDPKLITRLNRALTALTLKNNKQREILESAEIGGFVKANDQDFDEIRKIMSMAH